MVYMEKALASIFAGWFFFCVTPAYENEDGAQKSSRFNKFLLQFFLVRVSRNCRAARWMDFLPGRNFWDRSRLDCVIQSSTVLLKTQF